MVHMPLKEVAKLTLQRIPTKVYRLRWRFDFADKPSKVGPWDGVSVDSANRAWIQDKKSLVRACIEAECRETFEMETLYECDGHEYAFAQWEAYSRIGGVLNLNGSVTPRNYISGLSFFTNDFKVTVFVNGKKQIRPLTDEEKKFNFKEHSV